MAASGDKEAEHLAMDIISGSMYSLNFLRNMTVAIFDPKLRDISIGELHEQWVKRTKYTQHVVPYSLGSIVGYLYCGILLSKEKWFDLLPDISISRAPEDWGFAGVRVDSPKNADPSIKYTVRRIRNALGHGNIIFKVPADLDKKKESLEFEKRVTIKFHDVNIKDNTDTFDVEINIIGLSLLVKQFQGIAYKDIMKKISSA